MCQSNIVSYVDLGPYQNAMPSTYGYGTIRECCFVLMDTLSYWANLLPQWQLFRLRFIVFLILIVMPVTVFAEIVGAPRIIDGDTIEIARQRIRLYGIDAPEAVQECVVADKRWPCGHKSTLALSSVIGNSLVACQERDKDRFGRIIAVCDIAGSHGFDINAIMVSQGWALAYRRFSTDYVKDEVEAQRARKGIWNGKFIHPWNWRKGMRLLPHDKKLGACLIKGNIGRHGARIYHLPRGHYYARTKINPGKGERWFCTEAEAQTAGWLKSRR